MITGKLIKKMREKVGLTQQQLADAIGISQAHVAKIENEKVNPRLSTVNSILSVLRENRRMSCEDFMIKDIIFLKPENSVNDAIKLMRRNDISQLPVIDGGRCIGSISEKTILKSLNEISGVTEVKKLMDESFPIVSCKNGLDTIKALLEYHQAVLVSEKGRLIGIVTKSDLLSLLK